MITKKALIFLIGGESVVVILGVFFWLSSINFYETSGMIPPMPYYWFYYDMPIVMTVLVIVAVGVGWFLHCVLMEQAV